MLSDKKQRALYVANDLVMSLVGVFLFYFVRFYGFIGYSFDSVCRRLFSDPVILAGIIMGPFMMIALYSLSGYYNHVKNKSRLDDLQNSLGITFVATLIIFFIALINDSMPDRRSNYELLLVLWGCLWFPVYLGRVFITSCRRNVLRRSGAIYRSLVIASAGGARKLAKKLSNNLTTGISTFAIDSVMPFGTPVADISREIVSKKLSSVIIAYPERNLSDTVKMINGLLHLSVPIYVTLDVYQQISPHVKFKNVVQEPLINISSARIPPLTWNIKRIFDVIVSAFALILLSPVFLVIAWCIKRNSPGPVFYTQERVGYRRKNFRIIKFRTMVEDAETDGPMLSSADDPRITGVGHFLRKYRLDELPQFLNVLRGEMSLVGPRPERPFYVEKLSALSPRYSLIHQVRPGITSWGMVRFGYASSIEEMLERLPYDMLYIDNMTLGVDIKILFHTVATVLHGRGV